MPVRSIGVVGAGTMGGGIAQVAAAAGLAVTLIDISEPALANAKQRIAGGFDRLVKKDKMTPAAREGALALIKTATAFDVLAEADVIVEAATENADLKAKIMQLVDK